MVRYFEQKDREAFLAMAKKFYTMPAVLHEVDPVFFENTFEEIMKGSPYAVGLIAEYNGEVGGYALLSLTWSNEVGGMVVLIEEAYVEEAFRSCGIGKEIFSFIRSEFDSRAKRYRLEVTKENTRAVKLYRALGYTDLDYGQMILDRV